MRQDYEYASNRGTQLIEYQDAVIHTDTVGTLTDRC